MWPHCLTCYSGILIIHLILVQYCSIFFFFFLFFNFLRATSTYLQPLTPQSAVPTTAACAPLEPSADAAGNIWFGMFLCAFDWRTSRCSWLFKSCEEMWSQSCTVGWGTLKMIFFSFFFFLWSTCYFWVFVPYGCGVVQCCAVFCFYAQSSMHRPGLDSHSDQMICYTVNQLW